MLKDEINNSHETARNDWMHSTPRLLEVMDVLECNKGDIDCYLRIPTGPPLADPIAGKLPRQCEEGYATLILAFPMIKSWLPH